MKQSYFGSKPSKPQISTIKMKLAIFILFFSIFTTKASPYFQDPEVTIDFQEVKLEIFLEQIQELADMRFLYNLEDINLSRVISVVAFQEPLSSVLAKVFKDTGVSFEIKEKQIILFSILPPSVKKEYQQISGIVTDVNGEPFMGVTLMVKGTQNGTITNSDGWFFINADMGDILVFSYLGFKTQEIVIGEGVPVGDTLNIIMEESSDDLDEVIITGYNTVIEKRLTGAINEIETEDILAIDTKIDDMLQGLVPGVSVINSSGEVGAVPIVKIRGTSTLTGNTSPLWVVDGVVLEDPVPLTPAELNTPDVVNRIGNALSGVNPQDIETITVLKDASATAIYGVRAAGGVIVLTTKKGIEGEPVVNFILSTSIARPPSYDDFYIMNSKERIDVEQYYFDSGFMYYNSDANIHSVGLAGAYARYKDRSLATWEDFEAEVQNAQEYNTDWFDTLFRDALSTNANFNVSGGGKTMTYYASLGMVDQEGTDILTDNKRYTGSLKLNTQLTDNFNLEFYLSTYKSERTSYPFSRVPPGISNFTRGTPRPFDYAINTSRTFPLTNPDGSYYMYRGHSDFYKFNIMNEYENSNQTTATNGTSTRLSADWEILPNLKAFGVFNYTSTGQLDESYYKENTNQVIKKTLIRWQE
jgi:TonB-linked SusC/RagA family outer membrane protein